MHCAQNDTELARILALPMRYRLDVCVDDLDDIAGGHLREVQRQALVEAALSGGLVAPIGVGGGKTLITLLLPNLIGAKTPVLLIPAKLLRKTEIEAKQYAADGWWVSPVTLVSYETVSRRDDLFGQLKPDLLIADEAHRLKNKKAACTRKVARYLKNNPDTIFAALSGTILSRSLMDCVHLFAWALREKSPLPITWIASQEWALALDNEDDWGHDWRPRSLSIFGNNQEEIRQNVHKKIAGTAGVVLTREGKDECKASILLSKWEPRLTETQKTILSYVTKTWELPTGEVIVQAIQMWRHVRDIIQGFYYRWDPPPPADWLEARREWKLFVRQILSNSRTLDSEAQVAKKHVKTRAYQNWIRAKPSFTPNIVVEKITDSVFEQAAKWASDNDGIVWVDKIYAGESMERLGVPYYGRGGTRKGVPIESASGAICASISANSEGRNIQKWHKSLVLAPPSRGAIWEQMLGRLHRSGQRADTVEFSVNTFGTNIDAIKKAISDAVYQQTLIGKKQKILLADLDFGDML
jgi:hypothetical protein